MSRWVLAFGALLLIAACPADEDACSTTQDCSEQGLTQRECVNGRCTRVCERDADCVAKPQSCDPGDVACEDAQRQAAAEKRVCEALVCTAACPDVPCGAGERCLDGRCGFFFESFEAAESGKLVSLAGLGWNELPRALRNGRAKVSWSGPARCGPESDRDRCAGAAAHGEYFLVVERTPTPERGTPRFGTACRSCACCVECRDPLARTSTTPSCPGLVYPQIEICSADPHPACAAVCAACERCPAELPGVVGEGLNACELSPAAKGCTACIAHDRCLAEKQAENRACPGNYPACMSPPSTRAECDACLVKECDPMAAACFHCRDAARLMAENPSAPELWRDRKAACEAQGDDGCYAVPKAVQRSALDDDEQAVESPKIDLSGASGDLVLSFEWVAFNVRERYIRVVPGTPRSSWPSERQEVRVQLCGASCEQSGSWVDAQLANMSPARVPDDAQLDNGLRFAEQSLADWSINRREVLIPEALRTKDFRFRLLPRLDTDVRVGFDRIRVRRRP